MGAEVGNNLIISPFPPGEEGERALQEFQRLAPGKDPLNFESEALCLSNLVPPPPELVADTDTVSPEWRLWRDEYWGTSWISDVKGPQSPADINLKGLPSEGIAYSFISDHYPPLNFAHNVAKRFPDLEILLHYCLDPCEVDEEGNTIALLGVAIWREGEVFAWDAHWNHPVREEFMPPFREFLPEYLEGKRGYFEHRRRAERGDFD